MKIYDVDGVELFDVPGGTLVGANLQGADLYGIVGFGTSNDERLEFEHVYGNYLPHSSFKRDPLKTDDYFNGIVDSAWNVWKLSRGIK